jgi:hypothetical protein
MQPSGSEALSCGGSIISVRLVVNQVDDDVPHDRLHCLINSDWTASWFQADFVGFGKWFRRIIPWMIHTAAKQRGRPYAAR